ncbi:MAG: hypothetical protein H0T56_12880 [Pseudaminobacter sp.]|nr:hypothetical protein [Pseudaminobacter sp.]
MLKDSVPCPIPNVEDDSIARFFFETDITRAPPPFNPDRARREAGGALCGIAVAQMTRFEGAAKPLINHIGAVAIRWPAPHPLRRPPFIESPAFGQSLHPNPIRLTPGMRSLFSR